MPRPPARGDRPGRMVTDVHRTLAPAARSRLWATVRAATAAESAPSWAKTWAATGSPRRLHSQAKGDTGDAPLETRNRRVRPSRIHTSGTPRPSGWRRATGGPRGAISSAALTHRSPHFLIAAAAHQARE
eukprot:3380167-Alexandrium_andersonii.AAC.1